MTIGATTSVLGIFGDPVAHSLSPRMHNAAIAAAGLDAVYLPFQVRPAQLPAAVAAIRALGLRGVNVTVPHKEAVPALLDEITPEARRIGAVNTVVNEGGRLRGCNTDAPGFLRALHADLDFHPAGRRVLLLGAGGAARAAVHALAEARVATLVVANRTPERARQLLAGLLPAAGGPLAELCPWAEESLARELARADLVVNSTALGLHGEPFPLPWQAVPATAVALDMVYAPGATSFVAGFRARGARAADGRGMLAAQGEEAFRLWFGVAPPPGLMRGVLAPAAGAEDSSLS